jgi:DNA polymerase-3 subunit delta'
VQFKDVIGQSDLKKDFIQEIKQGKIAHAQLFMGTLGNGGLPLALAFTQYLFCKNPSDTDSCGVCPSCLKVQDLQHPDVHFVYPVVQAINKISSVFAAEWRAQLKEEPYFDAYSWTKRIDPKERKPIIGTDESVEIIRKLNLKSYEGGYKVMLIWLPEEMNSTCSNKLLKILEEPPKDTLFLLVSEDPSKLLVTIQSRTQFVRIPKIESEQLTQALMKRFQLEKTQAESITAFSEGNYIQSCEFLKESDDKGIYREQFIQLMRTSYKKDVLGMMNWADELSTSGKERQKLFIQYALHMFRQSLLSNYMGDVLLRISSEEEQFLKNFAPFISGNNIREFIETFDDAYYHIDRNANARILFTQMCFQTMRFIHQA